MSYQSISQSDRHDDADLVKRARCPILDNLPPELRLRIYEFVYDEEYRCRISIENGFCWKKTEAMDKTTEEQGPLGHLIALIQTCKTFDCEARPVLYDATTFSIDIHDDKDPSKRWKRGQPLGPIEECLSLSTIKTVNAVHIERRGAASMSELSHRVDQVVAMLPSDGSLSIRLIVLMIGRTSRKDADPIILALAGLDIKPGTRLDLGSSTDAWHKDSASKVLFTQFVEKCGITWVTPTDWHTKEPGWAEEEKSKDSISCVQAYNWSLR